MGALAAWTRWGLLLVLGVGCGRVDYTGARFPQVTVDASADATLSDGGGDRLDAAVDGAPPDGGSSIDSGPDGGDLTVDAGPRSGFCPDDAALIGCWTFDDTLADSSRTGQAFSAAPEVYVAGNEGSAIRVGVGTRVEIVNGDPFLTAAGTIELFLFLESSQRGRHPVIFDHNTRWDLDLEGSSLPAPIEATAHSSPDSSRSVTELAAAASGRWTHFAMTYDGVDLRLYVDGLETNSVPLSSLHTPEGMPLSLGTDAGSEDEPIAGAIDSLRIWSVARTPEEIRAAANR